MACNMAVDFFVLLQVMYIYFYTAYYFTCYICMQDTGSMLRALEISLHEVDLPTFLINYVTLFCSLKIPVLSVPPPQLIKPYLE